MGLSASPAVLAGAVVMEYHGAGDSQTTDTSSHRSGGWKSRSGCLNSQVLVKAILWAADGHLLIVPPQ